MTSARLKIVNVANNSNAQLMIFMGDMVGLLNKINFQFEQGTFTLTYQLNSNIDMQ